jgi:hypothetical protein
MHVDVITRENSQIHLLAVVIQVIVAVPGATDISTGPVSEKSGSRFVFAQTTGKKILVVVPDLL